MSARIHQMWSGKNVAVFTIIAAVGQLERSLIVERVKAGLRRARAEGKRLGRRRLRVDHRQLRLIANKNPPVRAAAEALGVRASSYLRLVQSRVTPSSEQWSTDHV